jgi:hypothetical protein
LSARSAERQVHPGSWIWTSQNASYAHSGE